MPCASKRSCNSFTRLARAIKSSIWRICEPMWKWSPLNCTFFMPCAKRMTFSMSSIAMPNLFSAKPVVIFAWVWAPTFGLMRKHTVATFPFAAAISLMTSNSGMLSTLKQKMSLSSPSSISQSLFPTPAKTILLAGKPALSTCSISPPDTQSMPSPASLMTWSTLRLALAFTA